MNTTFLLLTMQHSAQLAQSLKNRGNKVVIITPSDEIKSRNKISGAIKEKKLRRMGFDRVCTVTDLRLNVIPKDLSDLINESGSASVFSLSWHWIISSSFCSQFTSGVIGWHSSMFKLPHGAGRSPLNWSLRLGAKKVYTNCFRYSDKVDQGPIYYQDEIVVTAMDHISDLLDKVSDVMLANIININEARLRNEELKILDRSVTTPLGFPKLNIDSGEVIIDDKSIGEISCLIRSCSQPFPEAFIRKTDGKKIVLHSVLSEKKSQCLLISDGSENLYCASSATPDDLMLIPVYSSTKKIKIY